MYWILNTIWLKFAPKGPIDSNGSGNGMVPIRWQAIIRTNDGLGWWRICASRGLNELMVEQYTMI